MSQLFNKYKNNVYYDFNKCLLVYIVFIFIKQNKGTIIMDRKIIPIKQTHTHTKGSYFGQIQMWTKIYYEWIGDKNEASLVITCYWLEELISFNFQFQYIGITAIHTMRCLECHFNN